VLDDSQLADVFGIELDGHEGLPDTGKKAVTRRTKPAKAPVVATQKSARTSVTKKAAAVVSKKRRLDPAQPGDRKTKLLAPNGA
jgi:hypothetical protein